MIFSQAHFNTDGQLTNSYTGMRGSGLLRKTSKSQPRLSFKPHSMMIVIAEAMESIGPTMGFTLVLLLVQTLLKNSLFQQG